MLNLLEETEEFLEENNKSHNDVLWVGNKDSSISWEEFVKKANIEYDHGVATDLLIVGDGWWLERGEYDGFEWWEYKEPPKKPIKNKFTIKIIHRVTDYDTNLNSLNAEFETMTINTKVNL